MPRRREYPQKVAMMTILIEDHIEIEGPLREGDIKIKVEDHLTKEDTLIEDLLEKDTPIEMEDPLTKEDTPGGPPDVNGGPLMVEDPMGMEDPWTSWWTRTTRSSRTPWTSETHNSADSPSNIGYICSREYF